ncbi:MAG: ribosomal protein S18-alanine N-acetyltransferase [Candidatus Bathyarchaeota archaeon]|nr:ribosomal protein S18-alanine N-acetyltransferase [Candidatus Bathyarchaeota archaeon]MDH5495191.1 ribosomal protein S18-alanine N-acetyltransferase [Candidatus Bathyarchaeota archaeon]
MQTTFTLRPFKPGDLEKVVSINRVCLPENYSHYFFMDIYERYSATFIVAEQEQNIVGYIMCRIETGFSSFGLFGIPKKGHVVSVAVLPGHQHKGIGSALMKEAMKNMRLYRAKECYLEVRVSNVPAVNMYKKLGFQVVRTKRGYYADEEDAYVMAKKLKQ